MIEIHAPGYEGAVEEAVPVEEIHRARCEPCNWTGEEHDGMSWKDAEQEAIEHFEDFHADEDEDFDGEDEEDGDSGD